MKLNLCTVKFLVLLACSVLAGCQDQQKLLIPTEILELPSGIQSLAWHPDGKHIVVGYFNRDEAEVWDLETKKPVLKVKSQRRPINRSGQEVGFSPDGKYLVVQDFLDTAKEGAKFPKSLNDPNEMPARADKSRYLLARVWDWQESKEVAQLYGPGSVIYGGVQNGFCWTGGPSPRFVMHRDSAVFVYDLSSGNILDEQSLIHSFESHPDMTLGYWTMACDPSGPRVALQGPTLGKEYLEKLGFRSDQDITPVVVTDLEKRGIIKTLFSPTILNGVIYTADGGKLIAFGRAPIHVWDTAHGYSFVGDISDPNKNTGLFAALNGIDGVVGVADQLYIWDTKALRKVASAVAPQDGFRIAVHGPSHRLALATGRFIHFYSFNPTTLNPKNIQGE